MVRYGTVPYGVTWCGTLWYLGRGAVHVGTVWYGTLWYLGRGAVHVVKDLAADPPAHPAALVRDLHRDVVLRLVDLAPGRHQT